MGRKQKFSLADDATPSPKAIAALRNAVRELKDRLRRQRASELALRREIGPYILASAVGRNALSDLLANPDFSGDSRRQVETALIAIDDYIGRAKAIERDRLMKEYTEGRRGDWEENEARETEPASEETAR